MITTSGSIPTTTPFIPLLRDGGSRSHADLDRVWVTCEGATVADHQRVWAQHQTITDSEFTGAVKLLSQGRADMLRPVADAVTGEEVEVRSLGVYDQILGLVDGLVDEEAC